MNLGKVRMCVYVCVCMVGIVMVIKREGREKMWKGSSPMETSEAFQCSRVSLAGWLAFTFRSFAISQFSASGSLIAVRYELSLGYLGPPVLRLLWLSPFRWAGGLAGGLAWNPGYLDGLCASM